jgi:hypothetical protein
VTPAPAAASNDAGRLLDQGRSSAYQKWLVLLTALAAHCGQVTFDTQVTSKVTTP